MVCGYSLSKDKCNTSYHFGVDQITAKLIESTAKVKQFAAVDPMSVNDCNIIHSARPVTHLHL